MERHEAEEIVGWFVSAFPDTYLKDGTEQTFADALVDLDVRSAAEAAMLYMNAGRKWPTIAELREIYRAVERDKAIRRSDERGIPEPTDKQPRPEWVERWARARAAGDDRPFHEQGDGFLELHREHGSPTESREKAIGYPSGYEALVRTLEQVPADDRETWVQPDEHHAP